MIFFEMSDRFVNKLKSIWEGTVITSYFLLILGLGIYFLHLIQPIVSPILTFIFVVIGTGLALGNKLSSFLSISGIFIYISSWFLIDIWSQIAVAWICSAGVLIWFIAIFISLNKEYSLNLFNLNES